MENIKNKNRIPPSFHFCTKMHKNFPRYWNQSKECIVCGSLIIRSNKPYAEYKILALVVFLLVPLTTFAGGSKHETHSKIPVQEPTPITITVPPMVTPITPPNTPQAPTAIVSAQGGTQVGGTQVWCSSETAPGYVVGVKNGGCDKPLNPTSTPVSFVRLSAMPYTGLSFWGSVREFLLAIFW